MPSFPILLAIGLALLALVQSKGIGSAVNMLTGDVIDYTWMEIGFAFLTDTEWKTTTTTATNLRDDRSYSVFLSLPEYGGTTHEDGFPLVTKMNGEPTRNGDNTLSFQSRLIQPNDSACMKTFTTPYPLAEPIRVSWLLVQNGVYNVSEHMFQVNSSWMGRDNSVHILSDKPYLYHHTVVMNYTTGCDFDNPEVPCTYGTSDPVTLGRCDPETPTADCLKSWLHLGALQQIQSDINKFDGESMFLSIRARNVYTDRIELLMAPHSVGPDSPSYNPSYTGFFDTYETLEPELVAYFVYEQNVRIRCVEGLHIETKIDYPITSTFKLVDFFFVYDQPPGLYGMIGTLVSLADSTTLRVFDNTVTGVKYITQEDQCYDEETQHTNKESAFTFAIGESTLSDDSIEETQCGIIYNSALPSGEPTLMPSGEPSGVPSSVPSGQPSGAPSGKPSGEPSTQPTGEPSGVPSSVPSGVPSGEPSAQPSGEPSGKPSKPPSGEPSGEPSVMPSGAPFGGPSQAPQTSPPTGQPSSVPSGEPSCVPSGEPSGVPSAAPSGVPSGEPSSEPSLNPTRSPTFTPTKSPTFNPTKAPTPFPTAIPTLQPTANPTWDTPSNCTFQFMLVDTFGDGWGDVWANFTTTDMHTIEYEEVYSEVHQPNCSYKIVTVLSLTCSIEVSMLNGLLAGNGNTDGAVTPWENYWHINFKGTRYVGGIDSFWKVKWGRVQEAQNMVNYDPEDQRNECHECKHPKPKRSKELFGDDGNIHHDPPANAAGKGGPGKGGPGGPGAGPGGKGGAGAGAGAGAGGAGAVADGSNDSTADKDDDASDFNPDEAHTRLGGTGDLHHKPKPKPNRPPPPYLVQIALYDQVGDGYYDNSGDFDPLYSRTDLDAIEPRSTFPNILAYPKYYIMTKDRKKLIKSAGSICPGRDIEYCEEALPYKGKFVFRFAGFEPWQTDPNDGKDEATWRFCGMSGGINEEFEFEMRDGVCYPITNTITDELYCRLGFDSAIEFAATLNVTGEFADIALLTERDTSLLEQQIAELFPSQVKVVVAAMEHSTASSFRVELKITAIAEQLGYQGSSDDQVEALMTEIPSLFTKFLENGLLLTNLVDDLDKLGMADSDPLRRAEKISLLDVQLLDIHFQDRKAGGAFALPFENSAGSSIAAVEIVSTYVPPSSSQSELSGSVGMVSLVALAALVLVLALTVTRSSGLGEEGESLDAITSMLNTRAQTHGLLSTSSRHSTDLEGFGGSGGGEEDEDGEASSVLGRSTPKMMQEGDLSKQQAVHYEDDLDIYNKYMDKKTFL